MASKHRGCERAAIGGRGRASADCPECVAQVSADVIHAPECGAAFGRRDPSCGRCRSLTAGTPPATTYRRLRRYA